MRILFFGDISGRAGRDAVFHELPALRARFAPEVVIANAENAAAGFGLTLKIAHEFLAGGIDCLTTGNHAWDQRELVLAIGDEPQILRPQNFPEGTPGKGTYLHTLSDGRKILIALFQGRLGMDPLLDDPFAAADKLAASQRLGQTAQAIFVDFHAEMTSEKSAFANRLDGRVSAVIGTHTHVPTADARLLPGGTAFQTDAGMCGPYDSVIGVKKEQSIWRFTRKIPGERMTPAEGDASAAGCFIETDDKTGLATKIEPFLTPALPRTRP